MFRIIGLPKLRGAALAQATREADSRVCAELAPVRLGLPRTAREWTALVKIASGEADIPAAQYERLVSLGLVARRAGMPELTRHGRFTLGLPE
jgi:hypothetical protein